MEKDKSNTFKTKAIKRLNTASGEFSNVAEAPLMSQQRKRRELLDGVKKVRDRFENLEEIMQKFIDHCHTLSKTDFIPPTNPQSLVQISE